VIAQPALLAHHCTEAGLIEKAIGYWLKAGQQSVARSAMTEAVAQLQRGLELLGGLPEGASRQEQELELSIALGPALIASKGYSAPHVREIIARAGALAEQLNRTNYLVPLLYGQWMFHTARAEHDVALSAAEQVDKVGATRGDATLVSLAHSSRGWTLCNLGDFVGARASFESCQDLGAPAHRAAYASLTEDVLAVTLGYLGMTLAYLGFIDEARARARQALLEARQLKQPHTLAFVLAEVGWVEWVASSHDEARRYAEEMQAVSSEHGFPFWLAFGDVQRGWAFSAGGQAQEGLTLITRGIMGFRHAGAVISTPFALTRLAEAYAKLGRPLDGLRSIDEAAHIIQTTSERRDEAEVYRVRGDLLMLMEDQAAEECYQQALAVSARQRAKAFELRSATSLARLWRDQGKRDEARNLLAPVYGWFTEGFDTLDLKEAKALLDELAS
jgi:tetratricopeptide (TPR) repeat protein